MQYKSCIDVIKYRIKPEEAYIRINGWAFEKNGQPLEIITEINGKVVPNRLKKIKRPDVAEKFKKMKVDKISALRDKVGLILGVMVWHKSLIDGENKYTH